MAWLKLSPEVLEGLALHLPLDVLGSEVASVSGHVVVNKSFPLVAAGQRLLVLLVVLGGGNTQPPAVPATAANDVTEAFTVTSNHDDCPGEADGQEDLEA